MSADTVLHAYGVVATGVEVELPRNGIAGAPVETVEQGAVTALVSPLDAQRFGEPAWREHGEDPEWLSAFATGHQEVLGAVLATSDVLPFRLPGMYDDAERLGAVLHEQRDLLGRALASVAGHVEWGVKVLRTGVVELQPEERPRSGRDYLRRRSEQSGARERATEERRTLVSRAYDQVAAAATRSVTNPPQDPALSQRTEPMLLNSAHLLPRDQEEPFFSVLHAVHGTLQPHGMTVEVSGPWPPYNFVHLASEEVPAR